jgi:hypothetical protein
VENNLVNTEDQNGNKDNCEEEERTVLVEDEDLEIIN